MIAAVLVRDFMASVERRSRPELRDRPLVFLHFRGKQERVFAASADSEGVQPGMRLGEVQALCPDAELLPVSLNRCAAGVRELVGVLSAYTNRIEVNDNFQGDLRHYLDFGRLRPSDGVQLAAGIIASCGELHLKASVGIAAGKFTAFAAASQERLCLVRPGDEPTFLAPFPVNLLPLSRAMAHQLWLLGIERLGQFAVMPKGAVLAQFGTEGRKLHQWANGEDGRTVQPYNLTPSERMVQTFDDALDSRETLKLFLAGMIRTLAQRLERRAATTEQITLLLQLEQGKLVEHVLRLRKPLGREEELQRALHGAIDHLQLEAGVTGIELLLDLLLPELPRQLSLFEYAEQQERKIEQEIQRLARRYESQHFFRSVPDAPEHPQPERRYRLEALDE
jgi:DNA polymerase-4